MDSLETLAAGIKHVDSFLSEAVLEPDPQRTDWERMKVRVGMMREALDTQVLASLPAALEGADENVRELVGKRVASQLASAAALVQASGDLGLAVELRANAREISPDANQRAELEAADTEPASWARLHHARWLLRYQRQAQAEREAKAVLRETRVPALRDAARAILRAPKPLSGTPPLFRINGCGVGLYGERDRTADGWYVATYFICVLFIPILPLTAYRVRRSGGNAYQFVAKEALGPIARAWQIAVLSAAAIALGWSGISSWRNSPEHKAKVAIEAAKSAEAKGDRQTALERYTEAMQVEQRGAEANAAAEAVIRLGAAAVPDPCTAADLDKITRVVDAFHRMPLEPGAAVARSLVERLKKWSDQIGERTATDVHAALTVLDMAEKAEPGNDHKEIDRKRSRLRRTLADRVQTTRPLQALALYAMPPADAESLAAAAKIIDGFGEAPSLWIEAQHDVVAWADAATAHADLAAAAARAREHIKAARDTHTADAALIEAGDEKKLAAALAAAPQDQEIAIAIGQIRRRKGDAKGALATLEALGAPGRMTADAQQILALCYADAGDLKKADEVLTDLLAERLPAFQDAQRTFMESFDRLHTHLVSDAKAGHIDIDLEQKLKAAHEAERGGVFGEWLSQKLGADPVLKALRTEYLRHAEVVPASLALGQIKLRRAASSSGDERRDTLASAERVFRSIQTEAEGNPTYHLGMGQVYHRLGRTDDGNAELGHLLERKDPEITLAVARVYRELALPVRAKQIAEGLYASGADEHSKHQAAELLSFLVNEIGFDEDAQEMWLKRSDTSSPQVKLLLLELEARRLRRQGKLVEAERDFAQLTSAYERDAAHEPVAANNAAVAYMDRYSVTGDPAHLRAGVAHLEAAYRLAPQGAIVAGNVSRALAELATVALLDRWIKTRTLLLGNDDTSILLSAVIDGPLHDDVIAALRRDPAFRRSLDVAAEEQTLAPQKPDGYGHQIKWLRWTDDDNALAEMEKRILAMPRFDASAVQEFRRTYEDGSKDTLYKAVAKAAVERSESMVKRAERASHAPSLAAANMVLASHRSSLLVLEPTITNAEPMVEAARQAARGWPEGGMDRALPSTLVLSALVHAAPESPPLAKALANDIRVLSSEMLIHRLITGPSGAAVLEALRKRPEIAEAARLRKATMGKRPSLFDVILARIAGDAELEQAAAAVFDQAGLGSRLAIDVAMAPGQEPEAYELAFFKSRGK